MRGIDKDYVTEQSRKRKRDKDDLTITSLPVKKMLLFWNLEKLGALLIQMSL